MLFEQLLQRHFDTLDALKANECSTQLLKKLYTLENTCDDCETLQVLNKMIECLHDIEYFFDDLFSTKSNYYDETNFISFDDLERAKKINKSFMKESA